MSNREPPLSHVLLGSLIHVFCEIEILYLIFGLIIGISEIVYKVLLSPSLVR